MPKRTEKKQVHTFEWEQIKSNIDKPHLHYMASGQASNQTGDKGQKAIEISDMSICLEFFPPQFKAVFTLCPKEAKQTRNTNRKWH